MKETSATVAMRTPDDDPDAGKCWGDDISEERQGELDALFVAWDAELDYGERRSPFDGVQLSAADVY